jgi:hypothetical protein
MMTMSIEGKKLQKKLRTLLKDATVGLSKQVNKGAGIVIKDIRDRVSRGLDVNEQPFQKLTPFTIAEKKALKFKRPTAPLIGTGAMTGAFGKAGTGAYITKRATKDRPVAEISAPTKRAPYSIDHQKGVPSRRLPKREWFGISRTANQRIVNMISREIERIIAKV